MAETLISLGLDVGTTTSQLIFSRLTVENSAGAFAVPELAITRGQVVYESPVRFTPLLGENLVDAQALQDWVASEYQCAGFTPSQVDTGAVIITGETSRKENARQVVQALAAFGGDFVVATAGPHLESLLAAQGAQTVERSLGSTVPWLHMDIGGGTTNLALIRDGKVLRTGCLNIGGRLLKFDGQGKLTYVSPVLGKLGQLPDHPSREQLDALARKLTEVLEMAAGLRPAGELLEHFSTAEAGVPFEPAPPGTVVCFSGGVAECIRQAMPWLAFGDLGPLLGQAIRQSRLMQVHRMGQQTIRATVIGAGCHSTRLSGSTVFRGNVALPVKNLPVVCLSQQAQQSPDAIAELCAREDVTPVLRLSRVEGGYAEICQVADALADSGVRPLYVAAEQDLAKALGQALSLRLPEGFPLLCLDRLPLQAGDYLDVAPPIGPAFPVIIKTLILRKQTEKGV